ncbi:hypothetical protein DYP60_09875 [Sphaerochaeta halotolerans]|uniref:DUF2975 domain-containing protein n=1 Tax=Sphaerochaeta halotolerans TaxID=2293840 RepID=A0A372MGR4_9SPIR|nr:hypothetical protein DYP60_09875 [Sphaerochaeta halotolerans]
MKLLRLLLLLIHVFVGLGALAGGYACLVDPVTPLGATTDMLQGSPFSTFLIPGIVLLDCLELVIWSVSYSCQSRTSILGMLLACSEDP